MILFPQYRYSTFYKHTLSDNVRWNIVDTEDS